VSAQLRIARPVADLAASARLYREGLGWVALGSFQDHDGFDGVMLGPPGGGYHLELTRCRHHPLTPTPTAEDLLVLYLPGAQRWAARCDAMRRAGFAEVSPFNPYWALRGRTFADPDGYRVVVQQAAWAPALRIEMAPEGFSDWSALLALLRESFAYMQGRIDPPSSLDGMGEAELRAKAARERLLLARDGPRLLGCAFADLREDCVWIGKLAVAASARRQGIASALIDAAEALARAHGRPYLELQTRIELLENQATFAALGFERVALSAHPGYSHATSVTLRKRLAEGGAALA
jgi:GNAT superfamily N-acetyltransferase